MWTTDGLVDVYDTSSWQLLEAQGAEDVSFISVDDNGRVVTVHQNGKVQPWKIGSPPSDPLLIGSRIGTAATDGNLIILSDMQGSWQAIKLDTGRTVHPPRFAHAGGINDIVVSRDGSRMATAGRDGIVKLWDLDDGTQLMALTDVGTPVRSLAFSDDGRFLATIDNEAIRVYTLDIAELMEIARSRITRRLTDTECRQYLHTSACPTSETR